MNEAINNLKQTELNQFHEELAKTYFSTPSQKKPPAEPTNNRPQKTPYSIKKRQILSVVIYGLIAFIIVSIFALHRVEVYINVIPSSKADSADASAGKDEIYLSKNGELNRGLVKSFMFYENAAAESKWGKNFIVISNEISSRKAVLGIDFNKPIDMQANSFCFYAKGETGGEDMRLSLRDDKNNLCYSKINMLQNSWQEFIVNLNNARYFIDPSRITHVDFEINPTEKQNVNRSTVYLKDVRFLKGRD